MKVKYLMLKAKPGFESKYEIAQTLMSIFELSGVFSEVLLDRIFEILCDTLYAIGNSDNKTIQERFKEFETIMNTYSIFSDTFKYDMLLSFRMLIK